MIPTFMAQERESPCVAVIANRDREQIETLVALLSGAGASVIEIAPSRFETEVLPERRIDLVFLKLTTDPANRHVFAALARRELRFLNAVRSVELCQSRRDTFAFLRDRALDVAAPRAFAGLVEAQRAIAEGTAVWVRRDAHNIPLERRILGVARTSAGLDRLVDGVDPGTLFFQEFLDGDHETCKAYVVGDHVTIVRRSEVRPGVFVSEPLAVPDAVFDTIRVIGRAFGMTVYGVDFFHLGGRAVCLDINDFPSFRGIDGGNGRIRDHAIAMLRGAR
ncbi:MAG: hypothetical protein U1F54_09475 [Burkholderiales bacterium]